MFRYLSVVRNLLCDTQIMYRVIKLAAYSVIEKLLKRDNAAQFIHGEYS